MELELPRGILGIGLSRPKNPINVGAVLRAAGIYDAELVATSGRRHDPTAPTNTHRADKGMPFFPGLDSVFDALPYNCAPVAVEYRDDAEPLPLYKHPPRAFYIFGAEDQTLGPDITERCRDTVYIPAGIHNLAAAVNVVLYDRRAKRVRRTAAEQQVDD